MLAGLERLYGGGLTLQITDRAHSLRREELETPDVDPGEQNDRVPGVKADNERPGERHREVSLAGGRRPRGLHSCRRPDVGHFGEPFASQKIVRDVLGRNADARDPYESDLRRLGRRLRECSVRA